MCTSIWGSSECGRVWGFSVSLWVVQRVIVVVVVVVAPMAATIITRACAQLQFGLIEHVPRLPAFTTWRGVHSGQKWGLRVQAITGEMPILGSNDCKLDSTENVEHWEPPTIQRLYEDDLIIAISKPGTLLVHNNKAATLLEKQRSAFAKDIVEAQLTQGRKVNPVHRLDRAASGVMLFAKSGDAARAAQAALSHPASIKEYVVLARGSTPDFFVCDEPVNDDKGIPRSALTECEKLLDLPEARCSLLKVVIKTGRRHQIRKHLNHRAHHVVGDVRHGKGGTNRFFREHYNMHSGRIFLHAARLTFPHPLHLSRSVWTPDLKYSHDNSETETSNLGLSHHSQESLPNYSVLPNEQQILVNNLHNPSIWMAPSCSVSLDPKSRHQLLTIQAGFPEDLQQVLLSIPENLTRKCLLSLGLLF